VAEYGVNINLRVKGQSGLDRLNAKVKQLTKSVDNIRQIDIMNPRNTGGAGGKGARNDLKKYRQDMEDLVKVVNKSKGVFGKTRNQQLAAIDALQEYSNSLTIGSKKQRDAVAATLRLTRQTDLDTVSILENTKAKKQNIALSRMIGRRVGGGGGGGNPFPMGNPKGTGAALSSGLISGAFPLLFGQGIPGGLAGFAGGFAGTKIGGKMGGFAGGLVATAVLQQLTTLAQNMSELGRAFDELNPNVQAVTTALGLAGSVEEKRLLLIEKTHGAHVALAEVTEKMNDAIGEQGVKNLTEFAEASRLAGNQFKKAMTRIQAAIAPFMSMFLVDAQRAENKRLANLTGDKQLTDLRNELKRVEEGESVGRSGAKNKRDRINELKAEILALEEILAKRGKEIELGKFRDQQFESATKSIEDQNMFLQNQLLLGQQGAEIEKLKLETAKKMNIAVEDLTPEQVKQLENLIKTRDELQKLNELYSSITSTVETGLVDAIEGAIQGTKTLGDVARSVFTQIQRSLISFGVNAFLGNLPGIGQFFRAEGGPVSRGKSYIVGERGPEMFTPGASGHITPNHQLGGSTNVVVNVDASGSSVEGDEQRGRELGRLISVAVQSEIVQQKRPGGLLA
jgi:hypothetical protein